MHYFTTLTDSLSRGGILRIRELSVKIIERFCREYVVQIATRSEIREKVTKTMRIMQIRAFDENEHLSKGGFKTGRARLPPSQYTCETQPSGSFPSRIVVLKRLVVS